MTLLEYVRSMQGGCSRGIDTVSFMRLMSSSIEANKALVRRFFAAIESGDLHVFDEIVALDYDDHLPGQGRGRETLKNYFAGLRSACE